MMLGGRRGTECFPTGFGGLFGFGGESVVGILLCREGLAARSDKFFFTSGNVRPS